MGKSSKDKRDAYYRLAKEQGWRARSAFKLIQLDEHFDLFKDVTRVVDLCAAPGSWSQVLSRVLITGEGFGRRRWEEKQRRNRSIIFPNGTPQTSKDASQEQEPEILDTLSAPAKEVLHPRKNVRIVAIDLQPISALPGITTLVGDITHPSTPPRILAALNPDSPPQETQTPSSPSQYPQTQIPQTHLVDLILSDGAPDVTGLHDLDIYIQSSLLSSALSLALQILKPGGTFVAKIFRGKDIDLIYAQMRCFFDEVHCAKPRSSRASSLEAFIVCRGFRGVPEGVDLKGGLGSEGFTKSSTPKETLSSRTPDDGDSSSQFVDGQRRTVRPDGITILEFEEDEMDDKRWIAPFVACGDLSAWDSDATYHLPKDRVSLDPVQPPTAPPYKRALEMRKQMGGAYGKTGKGGNTS
ncbi:MAG: hypothetical protein L6R38_006627 [Xanthoria sp. 2 TBL-2021]|nr:MAG: hypothetical protein L6R38_006627 [Xanthoria sp. 2 TBL-2021]